MTDHRRKVIASQFGKESEKTDDVCFSASVWTNEQIESWTNVEPKVDKGFESIHFDVRNHFSPKQIIILNVAELQSFFSRGETTRERARGAIDQ